MQSKTEPIGYDMEYKGYTIVSDDCGAIANKDGTPIARSSTIANLLGVLDVLWAEDQRHKERVHADRP